MATTEETAAGFASSTGARETVASKAIHVWAALGLVFLLVQVWVYASWISSTDRRPAALGLDPVPASARIASHVYEVLSVGSLSLWLFWFVSGIRQAGTINSTRLMMPAGCRPIGSICA